MTQPPLLLEELYWGIESECKDILPIQGFLYGVWLQEVLWGGLAKATNDAIKVLDAYGCDVIFVETVGVGQIEVDIVKTADTVVLVTVPGLGDDIQAIKAGLMEIADIFVINKADKEEADKTLFELELMLDLEREKFEKRGWRPKVIKTVATLNKGIDELWSVIKEHEKWLKSADKLKEKRRFRAEEEVKTIVSDFIVSKVSKELKNNELYELVGKVANRELDPYTAAELIMEKTLGVKV